MMCIADGVTRPAVLTSRRGERERRRHSLLGSPAPPLTERARSIFICDPQLHHCLKTISMRHLFVEISTRYHLLHARSDDRAAASLQAADRCRRRGLSGVRARCAARRGLVSTAWRTAAPSQSILRLPGGHVASAILPGVEWGEPHAYAGTQLLCRK